MGHCGSTLTCDACYSDTPDAGCMTALEADADILGNGVLATFLVSAILTCGAILLGYVGDATHEAELNVIDKNVIRRYQASFVHNAIIPKLKSLWGTVRIPTIKFVTFGRVQKTSLERRITRKQRVEALSRFVLILSDQQLVTGLAILIGGLVGRCRISLYEYQMVTALAWFSSTTHLATLSVLRSYFINHHTVRNWRVVGMVASMILLIFSEVMVDIPASGNTQLINPFQCVFSTTGGAEYASDPSPCAPRY
ncbi:hypothetical protein K469DRAFT_90243 [Zopfia rhizophila CBS 207.26]|uniref:Uncharacterized protein n=1 Tax=Zopfia rhizophila CBS 207.26 TaxID=1314779 RepID=A0A6A6E874_9PEZI|nr:hypothetical protein K469DRAFT_90243 [Zopfia rhizophila CBS 207.26]